MEEILGTRDRIIRESLRLFAVKGYSAVSVRTIAAAVGVRDSALYKHFKSKQEIFNTIVKISKQKFMDKCKELYSTIDDKFDLTETSLKMFRFQTENPWIREFRQMLVIEQFGNKDAAKVYKELFIDMPINNSAKIFEYLIQEGYFEDIGAKNLAVTLYAPFFLFHLSPVIDDEIINLLVFHTIDFKNKYYIPKEND